MKSLYFVLFFLSGIQLTAQHTFSIVAVDTLTGEIGSAGASCLDDITFPGSGGAIIISDILPGRGAIHTQSFWLAANQANARQKMEEGLSPEEILLWLKQNDPEGLFGAQKRQFGIVDFDPQGNPRSAAFTGNSCFDWKGHRTGTTYAIQGNILLGPEIVDSMEARYLAATGTLADRLMAALQGANVVGADTRCTNNGTSSLSAFLRVAAPTDEDEQLMLDLNVASLPAGMEPIDSLQTLYNEWKALSAPETAALVFHLCPNPAKDQVMVSVGQPDCRVEMFNTLGQMTFSSRLVQGDNLLQPQIPRGLYWVIVHQPPFKRQSRLLVWEE